MILLDGAKLAIYGIYLNYYCYYVIKGSFIPHGTMLFFAVALGCILLNILTEDRGSILVEKEIVYWGLYGAIAYMTTLVFCNTGFSSLTSDIFKYFQRLLLIFFVAYICEKEKSIRFGLRVLIITAVGCAIGVFRVLGDIQLKLDITSGADLSANDIGALMAFGVIALLIYGNDRNKANSPFLSVFKVAAVIACVSVIFIAGSRKSIYAISIFLVLTILWGGRDFFRNLTPGRFILLLVICLAGAYFVYRNLWPYVEDTNLYVRMFGRGVEGTAESDEVRMDLYKWALQEFLKHPLIGVGYNNFVNLYGNYTHSTYAEPMACSGVIGLLYLIPYARMLITQAHLIRVYPRRSTEHTWQKSMMAFYIAFAFVGVGIPYLYKDIPCILLGMFLASQQLAAQNIQSN